MRGRRPKAPEQRQRRNRAASAAELAADSRMRRRAPALPARKGAWRAETRAWWHAVWDSPMAQKYLPADEPALARLALLVDAYWTEPTTAVAAEIRLQEARFGLTPLDRHRLQWSIVPAAPAEPQAPAARRRQTVDPRTRLRAVK